MRPGRLSRRQKEVLQGNDAETLAGSQDGFCSQAKQRRSGVGGRRGIADVASQSRPVSELHRSYSRARLRQDVEFIPDDRKGKKPADGYGSANMQTVLRPPIQNIQLRNLLDVHNAGRVLHPLLHLDDQVCPAGQNARLLSMTDRVFPTPVSVTVAPDIQTF